MKRLRRVAMFLTRNPFEADDLVQETVLRALANENQFTPGTNLAAWLNVILRNYHFTRNRRADHKPHFDIDDPAVNLPAMPDNQIDSIRISELISTIGKLPAKQRQALVLIGAEGYSYEEVAAMIGSSVGTIKSRVSRARNKIVELAE